MTETSLPEVIQPSRANLCGLCPKPKPASWCSGCPREFALGPAAQDVCHFVDARAKGPVDIILLAEAPVVPRVQDVTKIHTPFADDAGQLVKNAVQRIQQQNPAFANAKVHFGYAVLCSGLDPKKEVLDRCQGFLLNTIAQCTRDKNKPPVIITMGASALKSVGVKVKSIKELMSRVLPGVTVGDTNYTVIPTMSTKMLIAKPGLYNTFLTDLQRAFEIATQGLPENIPLAELTKDYVIPKTVEQVRDVCEMIINYADEGKLPENWSISVDTETNTKFPHRKTTKIVAVSFAWATGKATCIPLDHKDTPYDWKLVVPYILRVLGCAKPKILHNGKYDLKVFMFLQWLLENWAWDTMLAEHVLEEDKKGQYGLKQLTRQAHPQFANYADRLHEILEKLEGESQLENIRKAQKEQELAAEELAGVSEGVAEQSGRKKRGRKKKGVEKGGFENIPLDDLLLYGAVDADMTRRIAIGQLTRMAAEQKRIEAAKALLERDSRRDHAVPRVCKHPSPSKAIVANIAVPVSKVLARVEFDGIAVNRKYLESLYDSLQTTIETEERELHAMIGEEIKLNHAGSIANVLFNKGFIHPETKQRTFYPSESKTQTGQDQTTEKVLKALVKKYRCPFSAKKLVYSKAYKARNTFCRNVLDLSLLDGRLHTNYNIHGTGTGRLSSNDENMQNIPKKLGGHNIKKIFIPSDDSMAFVNCDAKSAEVKIFAAYSHDAELIRALNDGLDAHSFFASKIVEGVRMDSDADQVLKDMGLDNAYPLTYEDFAARDEWKIKDPKYGEMLDKFRTAVKRVVFGILYGAGPGKIAETIGISKAQAQAIIELLFSMFPSIKKYVEDTKWELWKFGCVETYFGRRRRVQIKGLHGYLRSRAERQAVNFKIQSTSSDIVMGRLVAIAQPLVRDLHGRLLLTVHDSIGFELPKKYLSQLPDFVNHYLIKEASVAHPWMPVPFTWDYEVGDSYGELMKFEEYLKGITNTEATSDLIEEAYTEEEVHEDLALDAA